MDGLGLGILCVAVAVILSVFFVIVYPHTTSTEPVSARTEAFRARCLKVGFTVEQCKFFKNGADDQDQ